METDNIEFGFLNYCSIYHASGTISYYNPRFREVRPCFRVIYPSFKQWVKEDVKIWMDRTTTRIVNYGDNNFCPFDKQTVIKHIEYMKKLIKFDYNVKAENDCYVIHISTSCIGIKFRLLLTWIRYLYEFPKNIILMDLYKLLEMDEFKDFDPMCLFAYLENCTKPRRYDDQTIANGCRFVKMLTTDQIKEKIKNLVNERFGKRYKTNDVLEYYDCPESKFIFTKIEEHIATLNFDHHLIKWVDSEITNNYDSWIKYFPERLKTYKEFIKYFKHEE